MAAVKRKIIKPVIGLAGGIGSGKSTVAAELCRLGCVVVNADRIGHDLFSRQDVKQKLVSQFGRAILADDCSIDRAAVAKHVFRHPAALETLDRIMHPPITAQAKRAISLACRNRRVPAVVLDAPLLFEAGWDRFCTHLVFVSAPRNARIGRVVAQRKWKKSELQRREKTQISLDKKRRNCCYRISNSSNLSSLRRRVRRLFDMIIHTKKRTRTGH